MDATEKDVELRRIAAQLTISMLDNHSGDWDDEETAQAFKVIFASVRDA